MIVRPPRVRVKHFIPQPKYKNLNRNIDLENKENIITRRTKCDSYQRHFGKEINSTNSNYQNLSQSKNQNILKKNCQINNISSDSQRVKYIL